MQTESRILKALVGEKVQGAFIGYEDSLRLIGSDLGGEQKDLEVHS